jgi:hypothetical protein
MSNLSGNGNLLFCEDLITSSGFVNRLFLDLKNHPYFVELDNDDEALIDEPDLI